MLRRACFSLDTCKPEIAYTVVIGDDADDFGGRFTMVWTTERENASCEVQVPIMFGIFTSWGVGLVRPFTMIAEIVGALSVALTLPLATNNSRLNNRKQ